MTQAHHRRKLNYCHFNRERWIHKRKTSSVLNRTHATTFILYLYLYINILIVQSKKHRIKWLAAFVSHSNTIQYVARFIASFFDIACKCERVFGDSFTSLKSASSSTMAIYQCVFTTIFQSTTSICFRQTNIIYSNKFRFINNVKISPLFFFLTFYWTMKIGLYWNHSCLISKHFDTKHTLTV